MRIVFISLFIFLFQLQSFAQNNIDVLHYKFNIGLNDVNDTIYGVAEVKVKFLQAANSISLDLKNTDGSGKGMKTGKVTDKNIKKITPAGEKIILDLFNEYKTGDSATFIISYSGVPDDGLIIGKTKYGKRGFFADNWPNRGHHWIPCHEDPADKATVEFIVTAPEHYQVVANGIQIEESSIGNSYKLTHWKEETPISTKVMVIGVADFAVNLAGFVNDKIPVYSWVYPENKDKGFYDYALAKDILPFFINYVGPYGYKKLANVQSKTKFGGLENANTIFYAEGSVNGTRRIEGTIAHEIAHQWFGNMATEKSFGHVWLSEGFATYFTILYFENKYGKDTAVKMLKEDREQVIAYSRRSNKAIVDTTETDYMKLLNVNSYQKGGWVLHMLRSELGDSVFHKTIRKYYATYAGSIAGTEDLQKVFENVSGKKLEQFFHQWLYTMGQPELYITWKYDAGKKIIEVDIRQLQKEAFHFPLTLQIKNSAGEISQEKIQVNGAAVSIKIPANSKPLYLLADPDTQLLMNSTIKEK